MGKMTKKERELLKDIKRRWANQCSVGELFCFLCGKKIENMKQCSADHWIPLALGGKTEESNLKPAHKSCNSKKSCMSPEEFLRHKDQVLNKKHKVKSHLLDKQPKPKKKNKPKRPDIGDTVYYVKETNQFGIPRFEIKEGVIIGYDREKVLVKDFYITETNKIESMLISIMPLTKEQALFIKAKYEKDIGILIQTQILIR